MGQWEFISGTANQQAEDFKKQEEKGFLLSVEVRFVPMVMRSQIPKGMWNPRCLFFEQKSVSSMIYID